jgi:hypothetical protein
MGRKMASAALPPSELYERDYYTWIQEQVRALRERRVEDLDWPNLAEEIEDLGKSEKRGLKSRITRLLEHLLKMAYASDRVWQSNSRGWELSVENAREAAGELVEENPGLRPYLDELFAGAYRTARRDTLKALRLPNSAIPETPPWTFEQVIDNLFVPKRES